MLEFNNIHKRLGDVRVLNGVNFHLKKDFVDTLKGGSGSGKTTLFPVVSSFQKSDKDSVEFERIDNWSILGLACESDELRSYIFKN